MRWMKESWRLVARDIGILDAWQPGSSIQHQRSDLVTEGSREDRGGVVRREPDSPIVATCNREIIF